eukprot:424538-Prymnesium_polylepis.1
MADVLRSSECAGAPAFGIDIILKGTDRAYTFVPAVGEHERWNKDWMYLIASAAPERAIGCSLAGYRDATLVTRLMHDSGSLPGEDAP